jgi:hypothetical protein
MTATLATLRSRVRDRLDEASARHWTDAQLNGWVNDGAEDIARQTESLLAIGTVSAVAGTQTYSLASLTPSPIRLHRIEFQPTGLSTKYPLEYRDFGVMDDTWGLTQSSHTGIPRYWTAWGFHPSMTLYLYPTPSQTGTIRLFYYRLPARRSNDGDTIEVPDGWENLVVDFAEYHALRNDRDQRWQEARALYVDNLQAMIERTVRPSDQPGHYVTDNGTMVPYWLYAME